MKHLKIGLLSLPDGSHLANMVALGKELKTRGHQVMYFGLIENQKYVELTGLEFTSIAEHEFPKGSHAKMMNRRSKLAGEAAMNDALVCNNKISILYFKYLPAKLLDFQPHAFVYDHSLIGVNSIFEALKIPSVELCSALAFLPSEVWFRPLQNAPFQNFTLNPFKMIVNLIVGGLLGKSGLKDLKDSINQFRKTYQLPTLKSELDLFKGEQLAIISQLVPALDYPTFFLPKNYYYCGAFSQHLQKEIPFPYERLSGKPIIYVSFGTLLNGNWEIFEKIDKACHTLEVQLIMTLGKKGALINFPKKKLSPNTILIDFAPQKKIIALSKMVINHAGLNSVLEALWEGKPMVCLPISFDHPAIAARMERVGVAEVLPLEKRTIKNLQKVIKTILEKDAYREHAEKMQQALRKVNGLVTATDIIERAVKAYYRTTYV